MSSAELKAKGNAAFSAQEYSSAISFYSQAIEVDPANHVLFSNRAACALGLKDWETALADSKQAMALKPEWPKGYSRCARALQGLGRLLEAVKTLEEGTQWLQYRL